jgi:hypothetical protein
MTDIQRDKIVSENDETSLTLPQFQPIMSAKAFLEEHSVRVRRMLEANWKKQGFTYTDVNIEDATIIQFLRDLRCAVNTLALLNNEQQDIVFNLLHGHRFEEISCAEVEGRASVDYWDAIVPLATYLNSCRG